MTSREKILQRLAKRRQPPVKGPEWNVPVTEPENLDEAFEKNLLAAGGHLTRVEDPGKLEEAIRSAYPDAKEFLDTRQAPSGPIDPRKARDLTILQGKLGVAENGAVWVEWPEAYPRSLLTLSTTLALILPRKKLVATMQEAYAALELGRVSYGIFLSGPSKTADIEQALVIGAHGAMELRVFLV
ncbi:LutC/YkgG family protein [Nitratifractor salsuginis]|uniref:LUD domain-containing protein n=1 Tax=Nitratifractor salsuginis (strain DSM 16511 / JCM 12458 / E9I37-1) TaxID=749222 RepID=E6WXX9_NITSE|nr:LUD domain-containing protein [Nitratifractor salsuginis]ADV45300.1 protein of unknown function DUF162 [Nitratifractor salsuginis DSM 16511]